MQDWSTSSIGWHWKAGDQIERASERAKEITLRPELRFWQHGSIFLLACAVIVSRRPDAIFHAQFWAEGGHVWFADAYNKGWWQSLFCPQDGYFQTFPRLAAALALLVPLTLAPLVMNIVAIAVQAIPVSLLLSRRSSLWGSLRFRVALAFIYLALPNSWELDANITCSQWLLALISYLVLAATQSRSTAWRVFDYCVLALCGLTGPFCIFLLPIAIFFAGRFRDRQRWAKVGIFIATCFIQTSALWAGGYSSRAHYPLGASPAMLARLFGAQFYVGSLLGPNRLGESPGGVSLAVLTGIAAGGTALLALCFFRSFWEMRLFLIFSNVILIASLIRPNDGQHPGITEWAVFAHGGGCRYWFLPCLAFAWTILWLLRSRSLILRTVSGVLLCILCFGIALRWGFPAFEDSHFAESAKSFESSPTGTVSIIPQDPPGWDLRLVKH